MTGTWRDIIGDLPQEELSRRVVAALEINYSHGGERGCDTAHYDNILNGRWFAVPQRLGGEKVE